MTYLPKSTAQTSGKVGISSETGVDGGSSIVGGGDYKQTQRNVIFCLWHQM